MSLSSTAQEAMDWRDAIASACVSARGLDAGGADENRFVRPLGRVLRASKIVIWQREIYMLAQRGFDKFVGLTTLPQTVPFESQFWFLNDFHIPCLEAQLPKWELPPNSQVEAMALTDHPASGPTATFFFNQRNAPVIRSRPLRFPLDKTTAPFAAMVSFLQEEIVGTPEVSLPRASRRRIARAAQVLPVIRIVQLRRTKNDTSTAGESDREWHHRWIVSGHWRRLSQPRKSDGALITFVRAYVKGPEHMPLLQPRESVYVVAR